MQRKHLTIGQDYVYRPKRTRHAYDRATDLRQAERCTLIGYVQKRRYPGTVDGDPIVRLYDQERQSWRSSREEADEIAAMHEGATIEDPPEGHARRQWVVRWTIDTEVTASLADLREPWTAAVADEIAAMKAAKAADDAARAAQYEADRLAREAERRAERERLDAIAAERLARRESIAGALGCRLDQVHCSQYPGGAPDRYYVMVDVTVNDDEGLAVAAEVLAAYDRTRRLVGLS